MMKDMETKLKTTTEYMGKVKNIISASDLYLKTEIEVGESLIENDITWLKFISNGKILLVADRCIKNRISWNQIHEQKCVFGKVITINNVDYLCRLLTSAEWDKLIVKYTPLDVDSHWKRTYTWCQNKTMYAKKNDLTYRVFRGYSTVSGFIYYTSSYVYTFCGWRPVLELL